MGWRRLVTRAERIFSGLSFLGIPELHAVLGDALVEFFHSRRSSGRMWLMVVFPWDVARLPVKHVFDDACPQAGWHELRGRGVADYPGEYVLAELVLGAVVRSASCRVGVPKVSYSKTFLGFQRLAGMRSTLACLLEAQGVTPCSIS